jgi:glycosyltransferase involved in cell wall biosynthesis
LEESRTVSKVVFGIPLYNGGDHLVEALESLLAQTVSDVAFIVVDDGSTDGSDDVVRAYAARDPRLTYQRNARRLGMVRNWRTAFEEARRQHPDMKYFAWGSDHDAWHPRWTKAMVSALEADDRAVLAYPGIVAVDETGKVLRQTRTFRESDQPTLQQRLTHVVDEMTAGNMVYGLFRSEVLARCGVYREILLPDRLLLAEASLHGRFVAVPEALWHRRYRTGVSASHARQRRSFFPEGAPAYSYLPWWLVHSLVLLWTLAVRRTGPSSVSRREGAALAAHYLRVSSKHQRLRRTRRLKKRGRSAVRQLKLRTRRRRAKR